jgi:hypothetical protein
MKSLFLFPAFLLFFSITNIELEKKILLENKIEILIPKEFKVMPKEMRKLKYPGANAPELVLSDEDGTVNIAFSIVANTRANQSTISGYVDAISNSMNKAHPEAAWKGKGIEVINGRKVGYLKLITDAVDQKIYNYLFLTDLDGKLMIGTFNCVQKYLPEWEPVADEMVKSFKVL